jgi:hypothetical protein
MATRAERTEEKRAAFLKALEENGGNITAACKTARYARQTAYEARERDETFAKAWDEAVERGIDALEDEALRRGGSGTLKPVFYQGAKCGSVREYSDTLLIFMLKAKRPLKFRDNVAIEHSGKIDHGALSDDELNAKIADHIAKLAAGGGGGGGLGE